MKKHFRIISSRPVDINLSRSFDKAYEANRRLFGKNPGEFRIIICHSQEEFRKESKYYYTKWATATVLRNGKLVIKSPFMKTKWRRSYYPNIIMHEMCHVFWTRLYRTTKPLWLNEGLACHAGKNFSGYDLKMLVGENKISSSILQYRYIKKRLTGHIPFYPVWQGFVDHLILKNGSQEIIALMDGYSKKPDKERYDKIFRRVFGDSEKRIFNGFLMSLKRTRQNLEKRT